MKRFIKSILPASILNKYIIIRDINRKKRNEVIFSGNDVICPICNSTYREFDSFGLSKRENAKCHNCGSLERHRLLFLYIDEKFKIFGDSTNPVRLLHFAPEKMFYDLFSNNSFIEYTPCDLFPEDYAFNGGAEVSKVDITRIPFADESFDFILCNHVLEHIPNDKLAMSELYRVLSKGGNGIIQAPIDYDRKQTYEDFSITSPKEREKAFGQHDHVRWYGQDYKTRLQNAGFIVNEDDYVTKFSPDEIFKYGLMPSELIYHCRK